MEKYLPLPPKNVIRHMDQKNMRKNIEVGTAASIFLNLLGVCLIAVAASIFLILLILQKIYLGCEYIKGLPFRTDYFVGSFLCWGRKVARTINKYISLPLKNVIRKISVAIYYSYGEIILRKIWLWRTYIRGLPFGTDYLVGPVLGKGSFSSVRLGYRKKDGVYCAMKFFTANALLTCDFSNEIQKEVDIWKDLKHPNIVHFYGSLRVPGSTCVVLEYVKVGSYLNQERNCLNAYV
jgi:Protein kinase domain